MCALTVLASSLVFDFESNAADVYYSNHQEPTVDEHSGYINLLVSGFYGDGSKTLVTIFWRIIPWKSTDNGLGPNAGTSSMHITVNKSSIEFKPQTYSDYGYATVIEYRPTDSALLLHQQRIDNTYTFTDEWNSATTIDAFEVRGNYGTINTTYLSTSDIPTFTVIWNEQAVEHDMLMDVLDSLGRLEVSNQSIYNQLFESNSNLRKIWKNQDDLEEWLAEALALIDSENKEQNAELDRIYEELQDIHETLLDSKDKDSTDKFTDDSNSQSDKLNQMNQQNQMDKIDVDSASSSVDANIDGNAIANYGVVLSSITGQGKVVQLMLIVLSVGLVSYVLFGKR